MKTMTSQVDSRPKNEKVVIELQTFAGLVNFGAKSFSDLSPQLDSCYSVAAARNACMLQQHILPKWTELRSFPDNARECNHYPCTQLCAPMSNLSAKRCLLP